MKPQARQVLRDPVHLLAFGLGSGLAPVAPGTFGTLAAVPLVAASWLLPLPARIALGVVLLGAGIWLCGESSRRLGLHDHGGIVMDEIAAFYLLMLVLPASWGWMAAAFLLFRLFDVLKPWPIRLLDERVEGGFGIMLDDVVAALFAGALLVLARYTWMQFA